MEKCQPVSYNLLTRTLTKCYPKAKSKMRSVTFQNCISHCNGYLKKNHTVDLKYGKYSGTCSLLLQTDCRFQAYRQTST